MMTATAHIAAGRLAEQTQAITGTVMDKATGQPLPGVPVVGAPAAHRAAPIVSFTDAMGRYRLDLPPGRSTFTSRYA